MNGNKKIKTIDELAAELAKIRSHKKVVLCHGVFDLLHVGHIRHFEQAKKAGDVLVVTITPDIYVNKGPHRPAFSEALRAEAIAGLEIVDYVAINNWQTAVETIKKLKPHIYAKGQEYKTKENDLTDKIADEEDAVTNVGGSILFTDDIVFSSSTLINRHLPLFPENIRNYLTVFSKKYPMEDILCYFDRIKSLKVLIIGEVIIDAYQYCAPIGMATKDPIITAKYISEEHYAGGILAVANHVAGFCDTVDLLAMVGEQNPWEPFMRRHLKQNIDPTFFYKTNSPTIVKRRFIDNYLLHKLFEIHEINDETISNTESDSLCLMLEKRISQYDVVIVVDFGHGMLSEKPIGLICSKAKHLAVNTQTNSGNRGFNVISKYPHADFICLNYSEINLEERTKNGDVKKMMANVSKKLSCPRILVTMGREGNSCYHRGVVYESPAFAHKIVDRMGAGDAVISLTSLFAACDAPMDLISFIGNAVAAQAVGIVGHSESIEKVPLLKYITTLLK